MQQNAALDDSPTSQMSKHPLPSLVTDRLLLRPFSANDGPAVERLAGAREVADTTLTIPHPYPTGGGTAWIMTHADAWERESGLTLAICVCNDGDVLIGAISVQFSVLHAHGELDTGLAPTIGAKATRPRRPAQSFIRIRKDGLHDTSATFYAQSGVGARMQKLGMRLRASSRCLQAVERIEDVAVYARLATSGTVTAIRRAEYLTALLQSRQ